MRSIIARMYLAPHEVFRGPTMSKATLLRCVNGGEWNKWCLRCVCLLVNCTDLIPLSNTSWPKETSGDLLSGLLGTEMPKECASSMTLLCFLGYNYSRSLGCPRGPSACLTIVPYTIYWMNLSSPLPSKTISHPVSCLLSD